jgi:GNAT superfamily N-acetyltransferase
MTLAPVFIRQVQSAEDVAAFVAFADDIYRRDPHRVAPIRSLLRRRLAGRIAGPDPSMKLLLAERRGEVLGTVSVLRDRRHQEHRAEPVAFFGFFESIDDQAVADALIAAAASHARALGATKLRGPRNFSRVEPVGVLVEGFQTAPPMLAAHQPDYYGRLLQDAGLAPHHDVLAYDTPLLHPDGSKRAVPERLVKQADAVQIPGLAVRDASWRMIRDLRLAHRVFVEAFRDVPDNTPMPLLQFVAVGWLFLLFTDRRMLQIATVDGRAAGFALCFPELNEAVRLARGRLLPWGWLRILRGVPKVKTASFKLIGVMPEFRRSGLHARMIQRALEAVQRIGFDRLEASLIDERNGPSRALVERGGMAVYKRYRLYELTLKETEWQSAPTTTATSAAR